MVKVRVKVKESNDRSKDMHAVAASGGQEVASNFRGSS